MNQTTTQLNFLFINMCLYVSPSVHISTHYLHHPHGGKGCVDIWTDDDTDNHMLIRRKLELSCSLIHNVSKFISHESFQILFSQGLVNFNDNNNYMVTFIQL